ncbi:hypothetical protein ANN_13988 [Periplaneta americana]|uniref:Uncharacterized protein n=1 Tax=Periplaneta americana TaxID=6978 RepID=A0ABQ8SW31_PERAM|nr:hypothetical protein ANN_13988 [Periplaneta americana]
MVYSSTYSGFANGALDLFVNRVSGKMHRLIRLIVRDYAFDSEDKYFVKHCCNPFGVNRKLMDFPVLNNLSAVRSVPGRSFNTTRSRHLGCNETETLGHVLRFCRKTELLRNNRHHKARTGIADVLKRRGWEVYEEIHCVSSLDSNRRADIVAIQRTQSKGIVLDPTIRFERDALQAQHVDEEKKSIYESCIPYLSEKYTVLQPRESLCRMRRRRLTKQQQYYPYILKINDRHHLSQWFSTLERLRPDKSHFPKCCVISHGHLLLECITFEVIFVAVNPLVQHCL